MPIIGLQWIQEQDLINHLVTTKYNRKYLIKYKDKFIKFEISSNSWNDLPILEVNKNYFLEYGIDDLSFLNIENNGVVPIELLSDNFEILLWTDEVNTSNTLKVNAQSKRQLVFANGDISIAGVETIDSLNLVAFGETKIAISIDAGITYSAFKNNNWEIVTNAHEGMTIAEFNSLTSEQVNILRLDSNIIRFSYSLTNDARVDSLQMKVTMQGYEKLADTKDYTTSYDQTARKLTYNITKSGSYSVNYVDGSA